VNVSLHHRRTLPIRFVDKMREVVDEGLLLDNAMLYVVAVGISTVVFPLKQASYLNHPYITGSQNSRGEGAESA
jgi:hypothetical protein